MDPKEIMIFGGGGNCFSFGTHLNKELLMIEISTLGLFDE
jgi:FlaA1/EpsC-like NDP-sugar epimerase